MQSLYKNGLEHLYDDMYRTFIDYADEFKFYSNIIKQHNKHNVLEIGCGTGNLATHFIASDINYIGLDISTDMIKLSKSKNPLGTFIEADIKACTLTKPTDSVIITGRTTSYLITNKDISEALKAIHDNLSPDGLLCFDFIDANRFLKSIKGGKHIIHKAEIDNKHYVRESRMRENLKEENLMFDWYSVYYEKVKETSKIIAEDNSTVRCFTKNEWEILLNLNDFEVINFIDRKSYAFDTYVVVAKKV